MPPRKKKEPRMSPEKTYLIVYNSLALLASEYLVIQAWHSDVSPQSLFAILDFVTVLQSFTVLEVLHVVLRDVFAAPGKRVVWRSHYYSLTVLRVGGRNFIIWFVMRQFSVILFTYLGTTFLACLLSWGCFDALYYAHAVELLLRGRAHVFSVWLRYSVSVILYVLSLVIEVLFVFIILDKGENISSIYMVYIFLGMVVYLITSYILFTEILFQKHRTSRLVFG